MTAIEASPNRRAVRFTSTNSYPFICQCPFSFPRFAMPSLDRFASKGFDFFTSHGATIYVDEI